MVQIDVPAAFVVSLLCVDLARKRLRSEAEKAGGEKPILYYRYLLRTVFFAGFVISPAGVYLLSGWPGWEQIYWSRRFEDVMHSGWVNALLPALFVMAIVGAAYLGHVLGYKLVTTGREKLLRPIYIGVLAVVVIVVALDYPAFLLVGTYDQFHNLNGQSRETMEKVWRNPYGFSTGWLVVMAYFVAALAILILKVRKDRAPSLSPRSEKSHDLDVLRTVE